MTLTELVEKQPNKQYYEAYGTIWKLVDFLEPKVYYASLCGQLRRIKYTHIMIKKEKVVNVTIKEKQLGGTKLSPKGYMRVRIGNKTHFYHRIIARTFLGEPPINKPQVNHKDGNKKNNSISNLEYVSNQENRDHAVKNKLHSGRHNGRCKIPEDQINEIHHRAVVLKLPYKDIAKEYGVTPSAIRNLLWREFKKGKNT